MTIGEYGYRQIERPAERLPDILVLAEATKDKPDNVYYFADNQVLDGVDKLRKRAAELTPEELRDIGHWVALERDLGRRLVDSGMLSQRVVDRRSEYYDRLRSEAAGTHIEPYFHLSPEDIREYFMGQLSGYRAYLAGEQNAQLQPVLSGDPHIDDIYRYMYMGEAMWAMAWYGADADIAERSDRVRSVEQVLADICTVLLDENRAGLAICYAKNILDTTLSGPITDRIIAVLRDLYSTQGNSTRYRQAYYSAAQSLNPWQCERLLEQLPRQDTPLIPGSIRSWREHGSSKDLYECYEESEIVWAATSTGELQPMPYMSYRERYILDYGTPNERENYGLQSNVDFDELPADARRAVELAIRVQDEGLQRTETLPYYKRLALWPQSRGDDLLYTVAWRDGFERSMRRYPDHHAFVTRDDGRVLDYPVKTAVPVCDTYMAIPYDGSYMQMQTCTDAMPNFFGPGEDRANAFWVMGDVRAVTSKSDSRLMRHDRYGSISRFVIVPVRYYQIAEDRDAPDPDSGQNGTGQGV